jgi:peptide chain release factor 1
MLSKLQNIEDKYNELTQLLSQPDIIADQTQYQKFAKAHSDLAPLVDKYREYKNTVRQIEEAREMLQEEQESDFTAMLEEEMAELQQRKTVLEQE